MTHRASGRRPSRRSPMRTPLHEAWPIHRSSPSREHTRRALRLFVTAGCYVAGLCLVLALVAVVAAMTAPGHASGLAADDKVRHSVNGPTRLVPVLTHRGDGRFSTTVHGPWQLRWWFGSCRPTGAAGYLFVRETSPGGPGSARLDRRGRAGSGATRWFRNTGTHRFLVRSDCTWTMRVQQRP
jgi:hypothetical protein